MPIGRASCSRIRSALKRIRTGRAHTFARSFAWSSAAAGTSGRPSNSRSSLTSPMHFLASWVNLLLKSTFFVRNAHSGKRPRYYMASSIRARCRHASHGTTMTSPVCTGTNPGSLRSRTSGCWRALSSTRRSSSEKPRRDTISRSLEAFGYALQTPTSLGYRDMREMFFGEAPPFDRVMADLRELEDSVNS